jgi:hypothetical protein
MKALHAAMMAGLAVMALATGASAADICCKSGTVVDAGSVYYNGRLIIPSSHGVTLKCDADKLVNDTAGTWQNSDVNGRTFELLGTPKDAQLAVALTAIAAGKKVWYCFVGLASMPSAGMNVNGHIRALYVTNQSL